MVSKIGPSRGILLWSMRLYLKNNLGELFVFYEAVINQVDAYEQKCVSPKYQYIMFHNKALDGCGCWKLPNKKLNIYKTDH